MEDNLEFILEYYEELRQYDFWSHREKILCAMIQTTGLYHALLKKGIITKDEWNDGISEMKKIYSEEVHEIEEKVRIHKEKVKEIEKNITQENKKQENVKKAIKDIFGIDF